MNEFKSHYLPYAPLMCIVFVMLKFNQIIMENVIDYYYYCYSFAAAATTRSVSGWQASYIISEHRRHHHHRLQYHIAVSPDERALASLPCLSFPPLVKLFIIRWSDVAAGAGKLADSTPIDDSPPTRGEWSCYALVELFFRHPPLYLLDVLHETSHI